MASVMRACANLSKMSQDVPIFCGTVIALAVHEAISLGGVSEIHGRAR
jgi:hypothetical protein